MKLVGSNPRRILALLGVMFVLLIVQMSIRKPEPFTNVETTDCFNARMSARGFVKKLLRSPSTAQFDEEAVAHAVPSNLGWWVVGYVEAESRYGGSHRESYLCKVRESNGAWELVSPCSLPVEAVVELEARKAAVCAVKPKM
jgi:hypothetical protein